MGSISRHITPLVIHSLGGGHTHINIQTFMDRSSYKKPGEPGLTKIVDYRELFIQTNNSDRTLTEPAI